MGFAKIKVFLRVLLFYFILGILSWAFFSFFIRGDFLKIQEIAVTGNRQLVDQQILEAAGVVPGENIFSVRSWEVKRRIERIPEVREAWIKKVFPRVLLIEIEEREPYALLVIGDTTACVDRDAVSVSCHPETRDVLPRIWMGSYDEGSLRDALHMIRIWVDEFETRLTGVRVEDRRLFVIKLHNDIFVRSEGPYNLQDKASLLRPLLREVQVKALQVGGFDLRMRRDIVLIRTEGEGL